MHQLCYLTIREKSSQLRDKDDSLKAPRGDTIEFSVQGKRLVIGNHRPDRRLAFRLARRRLAVLSALLRWLSLSIGGDIHVQKEDLEIGNESPDYTQLTIAPEWPCEYVFELRTVEDEARKWLMAWVTQAE